MNMIKGITCIENQNHDVGEKNKHGLACTRDDNHDVGGMNEHD